MKKFLITLIFLTVVILPQAYAQESDELMNSVGEIPIPTTSLTPSPQPTTVSYELPYPGILPGSPLYSLKALRDKLMEIFISDPLKKSSFYLLQADKRLAAGLILYERGDIIVAETTISKGQNYLEKSINKMIEAKNSQHNVSDVFAKIKSSSAKQRQELERLSKKAKGYIKNIAADLHYRGILEEVVDFAGSRKN